MKNFSDFHKRTVAYDGLKPRCKSCVSLKTRKYRQANPAQFSFYDKRAKVKSKYGLALEDYEEYLSKPCQLCGQKATCLDHDHKTGRVRGSLCQHCNRGLGLFKDDIAVLQRAIVYLT